MYICNFIKTKRLSFKILISKQNFNVAVTILCKTANIFAKYVPNLCKKCIKSSCKANQHLKKSPQIEKRRTFEKANQSKCIFYSIFENIYKQKTLK